MAVGITVLVVVGLPLLICALGSAGLTATLGYLIVVTFLWWATSGEEPWVWPYSGRTTAPPLLRLLYIVLQLNRALGIFIGGLLVVAVVVVLALTLITGLTLLFDVVADGHARLRDYVDFYSHDLWAWLKQAAAGHVGEP
jgi:hypothetical protein